MLNFIPVKGVVPDKVYTELLDVATTFNINSPLRMAHFLSQCSHESLNFRATEENLMYSADGLLKIFKRYFNPTEAAKYAKNPRKIASKVYANRMGNGDEASEDGYKYRGRGYIQLTGKSNYALFDKKVPENITENPDLVATKYPLLSAAWFFSEYKNLNLVADQGNSDAVVSTITRSINGGLIGLNDRIMLFKKFYNLLNKE